MDIRKAAKYLRRALKRGRYYQVMGRFLVLHRLTDGAKATVKEALPTVEASTLRAMFGPDTHLALRAEAGQFLEDNRERYERDRDRYLAVTSKPRKWSHKGLNLYPRNARAQREAAAKEAERRERRNAQARARRAAAKAAKATSAE